MEMYSFCGTGLRLRIPVRATCGVGKLRDATVVFDAIFSLRFCAADAGDGFVEAFVGELHADWLGLLLLGSHAAML